MATDVVMPQMGESIAEGTITKWLIQVGQRVERDQPLFEISTDKVDAEIPSPASGVLVEILFPAGTTVPVHQVVARIAEGGEVGLAGQPGAGQAAGPGASPEAPVVSRQEISGSGGATQPFEFDLLVLGAGPGGYVAAIRAAQLGLRVACIEKDARLGGTCLLRGCIPTKALLHAAEVYETVQRAGEFGVLAQPPMVDMARVQEYKRGVVDANARGIVALFKKNGIVSIPGFGRFVDRNTLEVVAADGSSRRVTGRSILIATGSVPRELAMAPTDGVSILNSDHLLELERVPRSLAVLGAGAVGTEFASVFASFGSRVTLIEMLPRILPIEDEEISKEVERQLKKRGLKVLTGTMLRGAERVEGGVRLELEREGNVFQEEAELLLVAVGRAPVTQDIGLEAIGLATERGYIPVNGFMQTALPHIYAIGDVVNTPWLAHVASAEGILAVEHLAGLPVEPIRYDRVPSCTYCEPEVGSVGLSEAKAREKGYDVAVGKFPFTALGKARILGKTGGFVKVVREKRYDELLGVHIVGPHATDLIAEACVALSHEATAESVLRTIHAHPTLSEAVMEASHAAHGAAIHI
jgi:dihydrolipoamide dehydrogenase